MKRKVALILCTIMCTVLTACGEEKASDSDSMTGNAMVQESDSGSDVKTDNTSDFADNATLNEEVATEPAEEAEEVVEQEAP
ncbi:MAG: hypothetical protein J1E03_04425 [Acetatifactor sp.]|nr:hypothetical protein [Acetatifactor sp.]